MRPPAPRVLLVLLLVAALPASLASTCADGPPAIGVEAPLPGQLSRTGPVALRLDLPAQVDPATLVVQVDGQALPAGSVQVQDGLATATLTGLAPGWHTADATATGATSASVTFQLADLERPAECELLNQVECLLPFPSSRFLEPASTPTGYRVAYAPATLPSFQRLQPPFTYGPLDPAPFRKNDGFSPTVQVLMHFPGGVDPALSGAPRLLQATRTYDERSLDPDSPTVLIDLETGKRVLHWIENDDRATDPTRVVTFLRPGVSLLPGHHYAVAVRHLVDANGAPLSAEPVFAAIRDRRPSDVPEVNQERERLEPVLSALERYGIAREDLILAFDFVVQSDASLTHELLSMRDQALAWENAQLEAGVKTWTATQVDVRNPGCADPSQPIWKFIRGTFQVPLFLDGDPFVDWSSLSFLNRDANGEPTWSTLTDVPFGLAIPCSGYDPAGYHAQPGIVVGHGLFGDGVGMVNSVASGLGGSQGYVVAGTNWAGMSHLEVVDASGANNILQSFIVRVIGDPDHFDALPDRLRQGQVDTVLLAHLMARGAFDRDPDFQGPNGEPTLDASRQPVYYGASLGGIMGTFFAAITGDLVKMNVDVPAINFSLLLQRATPFIQFQNFLSALNGDAMDQAIGIGLDEELWVRGEPSGYANHVTGNRLPPLPGATAKKMLVTVALYDNQVSNLGAQLLGSTLGIGVLDGSVMRDLAGMPATPGPQDSGYIVYDTASYDLSDPLQLPFVPPLVNRQAVPNKCDPHGRRTQIPASLDQLQTFLAPGGQIENFCLDDGVCNASSPYELPPGGRCNPLTP